MGWLEAVDTIDSVRGQIDGLAALVRIGRDGGRGGCDADGVDAVLLNLRRQLCAAMEALEAAARPGGTQDTITPPGRTHAKE